MSRHYPVNTSKVHITEGNPKTDHWLSGRVADHPEYRFTANQKIVQDDYPHHLTYDWTLPYRARRLEALITGYDVSGGEKVCH